MTMPKVSVIVPVYNVERYLRECLKSLCNQTMADIEILCVDDGSTDGSSGILAEVAALEPRIRVMRHATNRGLSAARNTGIRAATAPWVLFVDSDDLVSSRICERTLDAAERTYADIVFFAHAVFIDGDSPPSDPPVAEPRPANRHALLQRSAFAWTKLVRAQLLFARKIEFPEGLCFEDVPVHWKLVLESDKPVFLDEALVWYRQRKGSITYRADWTRADGLKTYDIVRSWLKESGRWPAFSAEFIGKELANFANTYAYYTVANIAIRPWLITAIRGRITEEHWTAVLLGRGLLGWQRDILLSCCRPEFVPRSFAGIAATFRRVIRDSLRRVYHQIFRK